MPICISIISGEAVRDGWINRLTDGDIEKILTRYKEHVSFWNIPVETIRSEIDSFARASNRGYQEIALKFDAIRVGSIEQIALYDAPALLQTNVATVVGKRKDDNFAYITVSSSDGRMVEIQYDLKTKKMVSYNFR